jgi:hypothetical protein
MNKSVNWKEIIINKTKEIKSSQKKERLLPDGLFSEFYQTHRTLNKCLQTLTKEMK